MPETVTHTQHKPATGGDIREILGQVDSDLVSDILRTGASRNEIMQACEWIDDDDYMGAELQRVMHSKIQSVYDILLANRGRDDRE